MKYIILLALVLSTTMPIANAAYEEALEMIQQKDQANQQFMANYISSLSLEEKNSDNGLTTYMDFNGVIRLEIDSVGSATYYDEFGPFRFKKDGGGNIVSQGSNGFSYAGTFGPVINTRFEKTKINIWDGDNRTTKITKDEMKAAKSVGFIGGYIGKTEVVQGTFFIIDKKTIGTASHVFCNENGFRSGDYFKVFFDPDGAPKDFIRVDLDQVHVGACGKEKNNLTMDFAVATLKENIFKKFHGKYSAVKFSKKSPLTNRKTDTCLTVAFHGDKVTQSSAPKFVERGCKNIKKLNRYFTGEHVLITNLDIVAGASGSANFIKQEGDYFMQSMNVSEGKKCTNSVCKNLALDLTDPNSPFRIAISSHNR